MYDYLIDIYLKEKEKRKFNPKAYDDELFNYCAIYSFKPRNPEEQVGFFIITAIKSLQKSIQLTPKRSLRLNCQGGALDSAEMVHENARYFWTSFMVLGMILPDNKFDHKSLKLTCKTSTTEYEFNPQDELGYFTRFSSASLYETQFKQHLNQNNIEDALMKSNILSRREIMLTQAQGAQIDHPELSKNLSQAFDHYLKAAELEHPDALIPLERIGEEMDSRRQLALSRLYGTFFHDKAKADYWLNKATEIDDFKFVNNSGF